MTTGSTAPPRLEPKTRVTSPTSAWATTRSSSNARMWHAWTCRSGRAKPGLKLRTRAPSSASLSTSDTELPNLTNSGLQ
nr:MAG TPA: hypothetical protein [Caudoviricetes sp.]